MSQLLIQKRKLLTFEQICPEWAADIKKQGLHAMTITGKGLGYIDTCIVGEAHGGDPYYHCEQCDYYSMRFPLMVVNSLHNNELQYTIDKFVDHWNESHCPSQVTDTGPELR